MIYQNKRERVFCFCVTLNKIRKILVGKYTLYNFFNYMLTAAHCDYQKSKQSFRKW